MDAGKGKSMDWSKTGGGAQAVSLNLPNCSDHAIMVTRDI